MISSPSRPATAIDLERNCIIAGLMECSGLGFMLKLPLSAMIPFTEPLHSLNPVFLLVSVAVGVRPAASQSLIGANAERAFNDA